MKNEEATLMACPFCGHDVEIEDDDTILKDKKGYRIRCKNPYCLVKPDFCYSSRESAVQMWNEGYAGKG